MRDALKIPSQEYVVEEKPKILQKLKHFLFGVLFGVGVSVVFLSLSALLMSVTDLPEWLLPVLAYAAVCLGAFAAGFFTVCRRKTNGLLNGALAGLFFFILQALIGIALGSENPLSASLLVFLLLDVVFAAVGGIVSVNVRR